MGTGLHEDQKSYSARPVQTPNPTISSEDSGRVLPARGSPQGKLRGMQIPSSKLQDWKAAEAELADIEQAFKALSADLSPTDRERVTQQLAALKAARLRVLLLFEEVKKESVSRKESESTFDRLAGFDRPEQLQNRNDDPDGPAADDWLS